MSKRVRVIVWTMRALHLDVSAMDVLHINQVNNLSPLLSDARSLRETGFDSTQPPNSDIDGLVNQDLCELTFPDQTFDLVIHSETLEHVFNYEQALREVRRVLRPGGIQIYTIPLLHTRRTIQRASRRMDGTTMHLRPPSYHGLEAENLVVWEFGGDFIRERSRLIHQIVYDDFFANPTVFAVVERVADHERDPHRAQAVSTAVRTPPPDGPPTEDPQRREGRGLSRHTEPEPGQVEPLRSVDSSDPATPSAQVDGRNLGSAPGEDIRRRSHDDWHLRSKQVRALRQEIKTQADTYALLEGGYREVSAHNRLLEAEYLRLQGYARQLESVVAELRSEIDEARAGIATSKNYANSLEVQLQALSSEFGRLESTYRDLCAYVQRVECELEALGSEYSKLESAYREVLGYAGDLESTIRSHNTEHDAAADVHRSGDTTNPSPPGQGRT